MASSNYSKFIMKKVLLYALLLPFNCKSPLVYYRNLLKFVSRDQEKEFFPWLLNMVLRDLTKDKTESTVPIKYVYVLHMSQLVYAKDIGNIPTKYK